MFGAYPFGFVTPFIQISCISFCHFFFSKIHTFRVRTIGPSEPFLGQIIDFFCENQFSPETRTIGTSFWGNPRSNSPWKQAILEIGLTLFLGSDSLPPHAHTNTHNNHSYLVRDSVACANQKCVLQLRCFWMRRTRFENHPKQMVRGLRLPTYFGGFLGPPPSTPYWKSSELASCNQLIQIDLSDLLLTGSCD
jgi:hypothetical protein